jgi:DnaK suppressor protein
VSLDTSARPPTPTAPPVRPDQVAAIRAALGQHRQARQDQIKAHTFADPDTSDLDPPARMRALSTAKLILVEIDQALSRLDDGSYGFCLGCTEPIPNERLLTVPYTRHCVPCA